MRTSLVKARTGYYEVRWSDGGRSRTVSTRTRDRVEAQAFRSAWIAAQRDGLGAKEPTVGELIDLYEKFHVEANGITEAQKFSLKPVRAFFGSVQPSLVGPALVDDYRLERLSAKRKDSTIRRELGALSTVLHWAVRHRRVDLARPPAIGLPPPGPPRTRFLVEEDEVLFHALAMGDSIGEKRLTRLTRFVAIALDTGARKEAIEGLTWDRVDLVRGLIDFRDPQRRATKKRRVVVPISDRLMPMLVVAHRQRVSEFVLDNDGDMRSAWRTFRTASPWPKLGMHDLRRTWASLAVQNGVPIADVAEVLGDTVPTVMKHYAQFIPGRLRGAVNARWNTEE